MATLVPDRLEERFWKRHSNPKSGWSRTALTPVLLYAVYHRKWRLAGAAVLFALVNPVLFPPPADDDAWMTRVVLAERWWTRERKAGLLDRSYPNGLNLLNVPVSIYAFLAAYRRRPVRAGVAGAVSMALKFWYVGALVRRYDAAESRDETVESRDD
ncbi:DUF6653 family protein [Halorubrum sp. CSM-61]|uniref:DUF6653 family protein n=1 Tax=Halorubrum sp. CSM-61 TaxID=2485838 RepID=UPI000F4B65C9|nr:DUF6653 family protein [Halorubrum sp. CSM-61]